MDFIASENFTTKKFNIIFLDPPFKDDKINKILNLILDKDVLEDNGLIIIHRHIKDKIKLIDKLEIIEEKKYGISKIYFLKKLST